MASWKGIVFYEAHPGSPNETWATDSSRVTRTLLFFGDDLETPITLDQRHAIAEAWIGYAKRTVAGGKVYLTRETPHFYPSRNGLTYLYCQALLHSEMGGMPLPAESPVFADIGDKTASFPCWKATFQYASLPYRVKEDSEVLARSGADSPLWVSDDERYPDEGDALWRGLRYTRYVHRSIESGGRVIPIRQGMMKYAGILKDDKPVPTAEPFPWNEVYDHWTYTWYGVPEEAVPWNAIHACANHVNHTKFDGAFLDTLLFLGQKMVQRQDSFGQFVVDITYRFMWCPRPDGARVLGHQGILRVHAGGINYERISSDGTDDPAKYPYRRADMTALFRPE
jgi:hypothetical protein